MANYPNSTPSFTTHNQGDVINASDVNSIGDEVTAIGGALLNGLTHSLTVNGQIAFPSSQNASTGANTLDDYEEGTWTPNIASSGGGTATYTTRSAFYVKVGQNVTYAIRITLATKGTLAAGTVLIDLPFAHVNALVNIGGASIGYFSGLSTSVAGLTAFHTSASTTLNLYYVAAAGATGTGALLVSDIGANFDILIGGSYRASA